MVILFIYFVRGTVNSFDCGSNGSYGALIATDTSGTVTLDLPPDGILNCTQVRIDSYATIKFNRNSLNTPVYILSQGDIEIYGIIDVSGQSGTNYKGGEGGPGGFDGGMPGYYGTVEPGDGIGPGGGIAGIYDNPTQNSNAAGPGAYGGSPNITNAKNTAKFGMIYGSPLLFPLVGGSGGGGAIGKSINDKGIGGSGGGGAILLASNMHITVTGNLYSFGGDSDNSYARNYGSGGAIRLVAPEIIGDGTLIVWGGPAGGAYSGGHGRIRIDTYNRSNLNLQFYPNLTEVMSVGSNMTIFPSNMPKLDIIKAAGENIPDGTTNDIKIILGFEDPQSQIIRVQARNFTGIVPISVVLIPETGSTSKFDADIDMSKGNPSYVDVTVQMPKNTLTHIFAWTRSF
jgi:hypothetical protein